MVNMEEFRKAQRAEGPATIMAIGTATPPNCVLQSTYPDYYFRVTKSEHKKELKEKFKRMCDKTMIKKRYTYLTEEILKEKPNISAHMAPSLDERLNVALVEIPKLGAEAATRAIKEWGQPKSKITHLVFSSTCAVEMPGADFHIIELLGLDPCVKRVPLIQQGCHSGAIALRIAKDLAENNKGARVLLICSENTVVIFRGPDETLLDNLIGQALFGDGAVSLLIGSDPLSDIEKPLFEIISASQTIIPDSKLAITAELREAGVNFHLQRDVPELIAKNIEKIVAKSFQPFGVVDWNSLFWVSHPGGAAILDKIEETLQLTPDKLRVSRHVLSEYGNMSSPSVLFALNEMRLSSARDGFHTTGEGLDWGVLIGFGPGITVEALVLRSMSI